MPQSLAEQLKSIPMSSNLGESLERAHQFAREQTHRAVTLEHLLLALVEDSEAAGVLSACHVDLVKLGTDVSGYLGGLLEDMRAKEGDEPRADGEMLRVLQAAAQAAQQSRRRQIDGAIVLAAIVGDAKSPAAGLLKAHGLTFDEAIRALQKATAQATAQARSKLYAKPAARPGAAAPAPAPAATQAQPPAPAEATEPRAVDEAAADPGTGGKMQAAAGQSAEDILAAARARIQQRSGTGNGAKGEATRAKAAETTAPATPKPEAPPATAAAETTAPAPPADAPASTQAPAAGDNRARALSAALAEVQAQSGGAPEAPTPTAHAPQQRWTPPPNSPAQQPAGRTPPAPPAAPPFPARPLKPGEGPPRPPLPPSRAGAAGGFPRPGFPKPPARAPWPDPGERGVRAGLPNGAASPHHGPEPPAPAPQPVRSGAAPRPAGQHASGPLIEHIPRRMRVGVASAAEVRIARDRIEGLVQLLNGRAAPPRPDAAATRSLSVRLRTPDGAFWIEPLSPETVWVEAASGQRQDEQAGWRWTVTPRRRGRRRLLLVVTARTIGGDGLAVESAPPERTIEVKVGANHARRLLRWAGLIVVLLAGAGLGQFGTEGWQAGLALFNATLERFIGG